jgi:N4-gp56 family major capsid protein
MAATSSDVLTSATTLTADTIPLLIKEKLLSIAEKQTVFYELADKENLPEGNGKTIQFTRYERLNLPTTTITEGTPPAAQSLTTSVVQAVVDQWGATVALTDVAMLTVKHPVLRVAQDRLGTQHSETVDREIIKSLLGGSNVSFPAPRTSRSGLIAGDYPTTDLMRTVVSGLRATGAPTFDAGMYAGVVDPYHEMDLTKDATFVNAASYSNIRSLFVNEIGQWMGVRWKRSNLIPIFTTTGLGTWTWAADTTLATAGGFGASSVGFAAGTTSRAKVTKVDPVTGFETIIQAETTVTNAGAFGVRVTAPTATGVFNLYVTLESGATGTATFQLQVTNPTGQLYGFCKLGGANAVTTTYTGGAFTIKATGAVAPADTSTAGNVHVGWVFGREAFGVIDLAGLQTFLTPAQANQADPLAQLRYVGWKQLFKTVLKNTSFFTRFEALSAYN